MRKCPCKVSLPWFINQKISFISLGLLKLMAFDKKTKVPIEAQKSWETVQSSRETSIMQKVVKKNNNIKRKPQTR